MMSILSLLSLPLFHHLARAGTIYHSNFTSGLSPFSACNVESPSYSTATDGNLTVYFDESYYDGTRDRKGAEICVFENDTTTNVAQMTKEGWQGFSIYVPSDTYPTDKSAIIAQQFCPGGCSSWCGTVEIVNNTLQTTHRAACSTGTTATIVDDIERDAWHSVVVHMRVSEESDGAYEVWWDGEQVYSVSDIDVGFGTWDDDDALTTGWYFKNGEYCFDTDAYTDATRTLYFDNITWYETDDGSDDGATLIRRGTEVISARLQPGQDPLVREWIGIFLIFFTVFAFLLVTFWVAYTSQVIAALAAIEDPNSNPPPYIRLDNQTDNSNNPELTTTAVPKPITSDLRTAINYLFTLGGGGIFSTFRGFRMYLAFISLDMVLALLMPAFIPIPIHMTLASFLANFMGRMFLATWQMAWVHVVIADKSPFVGYRRMLGYQNWKRIAPVAVLHSAVMSVISSLNLAVSRAVGWVILGFLGEKGSSGGKGEGGIGVVLLFMFFFSLTVPVNAIFTRVAASMLPEGLDPIVPFDRQFGGKVKMGSGNARLGIVDAWRTFERSARVRYFKVIFQAIAIEIVLGVVGGLLVLGELKWLLYSH
ncbi:polysaccharide lyase-domain-containing protein [Aspergillus tubingensis]|uniref:polysaccharide lyase-domain-containing protein n=1 Tax=Aspergillus tubingensis TaxID=5068 RepID=UPI001578EA99|nr:polysaccharide lyase-domain-containing protein [Aspergillus tubingensis]GFN15282.1 polysaccharide lyase-domain-containing protein [Aspergillus tubingensis]